MATFTFDELYGAGVSSPNLTAGTPYTFTITNNPGSSYLILESIPDINDIKTPNTSGTYTSMVNIVSSVIGDYTAGFALSNGSCTFVFTPAINVVGTTLKLRGTGGISLVVS